MSVSVSIDKDQIANEIGKEQKQESDLESVSTNDIKVTI